MAGYDVIVVGGGAMGSAAAWALTRAGRSVLLLERFEAGHTRGGSHGATRLFRLGYAELDYVRLAQRALRLWRELEVESGVRLLTTTGAIDHGADGARQAELTAGLTSAGVEFDVLSPAEAGERWSGMAFASPVVYQPDGGRLHADAAVETLRHLAARGGATIHYGRRVTGLVPGEPVRVDTETGPEFAGQVVVAVGSWAPALLGGLVELPPLRVTQEQPAHFQVRDPGAQWPSFVHWDERADGYGLFAPGEGLKVGLHGVGPVVDPDERDFTPSEANERELRDYVERWLPGADPATAASITCLYDNTATDDFVLDRTGPLTVATGFSGHGFKFVPAIGELLAGLVTGERRAPDRFSLHRRLA